jgi:hypothetical protein
MKRPKKQLLFSFILLGVSSLLCLLLFEVACALLRPSLHVTTDLFGRNFRKRVKIQMTKSADGRCYDANPNQVLRDYLPSSYDVTYHYDQNSIRTKRKYEIKEKGQLRVLVLGDSQTLGQGLHEEQTYSYKVEQKLQAKYPFEIRFFNTGVGGFGTYEPYCKLKKLYSILRPHLILYTMFVENALVYTQGNDLYNNLLVLPELRKDMNKDKPKEQTLKAKSAFLSDHSHTYNLLSDIKRGLKAKTYQELYQQFKAKEGSQAKLDLVWDKTRDVIKEFARPQEGVNLPVVLVHLPTLEAMGENDKGALEELKKTGFPTIDLYDVLKPLYDKDPSSLRFKLDSHYNDMANTVMADKITAGLLEWKGWQDLVKAFE